MFQVCCIFIEYRRMQEMRGEKKNSLWHRLILIKTERRLAISSACLILEEAIKSGNQLKNQFKTNYSIIVLFIRYT